MTAITRLPERHVDFCFCFGGRELRHAEDMRAGSKDDVMVLTACAQRIETQQQHRKDTVAPPPVSGFPGVCMPRTR